MKKLPKKLLALAISAAMAVSMGVTAFSAGGTMRIDGDMAHDSNSPSGNTESSLEVLSKESGRDYRLYQIFTGDVDSAETSLGNVEWGCSVYGDNDYRLTLIQNLKDITTYPALQGVTATKDSEGNISYTASGKSIFDGISEADVEGAAAEVATILASLTDTTKRVVYDTTTDAAIDAFAQAVGDSIKVDDTKANTHYSDPEQLASTTSLGYYQYQWTGIESGYYLVREDSTTTPKTTGETNSEGTSAEAAVENPSYAKFMIRVAGAASVREGDKTSDGPGVEKDVVTGKDAEGKDTTATKTDAAIGDELTYRITLTIPDMDDYSKYFFIADDTMSKGLTLNYNYTESNNVKTYTTPDLKVYIGTTNINNKTAASPDTNSTSQDGAYKLEVEFTYTKTDGSTGTTGDMNALQSLITSGEVEDGNWTTKIYITFRDFIQYKDLKGQEIQIEYKATINPGATIGDTGSSANGTSNNAGLTYSNDPNYNYKGTDDDEDVPNEDGDDDHLGRIVDGDGTGSAKVYTAGTVVQKMTSTGKRLSGAKFKISNAYDWNGDSATDAYEPLKTIIQTVEKYDAVIPDVIPDTEGTKSTKGTDKDGEEVNRPSDGWYYRADTGIMTQYETPPTSGYSSVYKEYSITDTSSTPTDSNTKQVVTGEYYKVATDFTIGEGNDTQTVAAGTYVSINTANTAAYDNGKGKYESWIPTYNYTKTSEVVYEKTDGSETTGEVTTSENGTIEFDGMAQGYYKISETGAPSGYAMIEDEILVKVTFDSETGKFKYYIAEDNTSYSDNTNPDSLTWTGPVTSSSIALFDGEVSATLSTQGRLLLEVENKTSGELPSTGGIGTTIFYIIGACLVGGAVIVLITRRRMRSEA